ncbi:hypothetical protein ACTJJ0_03515 [Chitinophaga sp. 22321]|uniref:Transposase n=1 Tax=Chitinophaga hostae TaxID=2831022 RepID=A0ABS5IY46_9BACT|nr:hypothetical protein [Chitinophaga hostae]MBS0027711.1 hypothetical protein [Chitinophaga hostae]
METRKITVTRKIQLLINSDDDQVRHTTWQTLWQWQHFCFRAANQIATHHFIQDQIKELFYLKDETKVKLSDVHKDPDGILTTSKTNTTYQFLSKRYKQEMPMAILGCLNNTLVSTYNKEKESYWIGDRSLRNYKRNIPIPIPAKALLNIHAIEGSRNYSLSLYGLLFRTYFGKDIDDKYSMWKRSIDGDYKRCDSSLQLDGSKIYLLTVFQFAKQVGNLKPEIIAEASLSMEIPIVVKINRYQYRIGTKEDFLYRRLAIQEAIQRCQKSSSFNRTKNGKARMRQKVNSFRDAEKRYINYKLHVYSKRVIDLCIKHQAGTLLLLDQQATEDLAKENKFIVRNWNYGGLRQKIGYKANKAGINIIIE